MTGPGQQYPHNQQFPGQPGGPQHPGGQPYQGAPQFPGGPRQPGAQPFPGGPRQYPGGPQGWQQPPAPRRRSKTPWLVTGAALVVVAAIVVVLVIANNNKPVPNNSAAGPAPTHPTTAAPKPQPGVPIPCQGDEKFYCVPGITDVTRQVQPAMQAQGYTCGPASAMPDAIDHSVNLFCENTTDPKAMRQIKVDFAADDEKATNLVLGKIDVSGMADTWESTDLSQDAWAQEKQGFDAVTAIVFPQAPKVRQDLDNWLATNAATCGSGGQPMAGDAPTAHVDGYIISCQRPSPVSISGNKGTNTNYEGVINLDVNPYAFLDTDGNQPPG